MKLAFFLASLILWGTTLASEVSFGRGEHLDCKVAKRFAISDALNNYSQHEFEINQHKHCSERNALGIECSFSRDVKTNVAGSVKKILSTKQHTFKDQCVVDVKVEIERYKEILAKVSLKEYFLTGEKIDLSITTNEPLYIYIFNIYYTDKIKKLYPLTSNDKPIIGNWSSKNVDLIASLTDYYEQSDESLLVVFSKQQLTFSSNLTIDHVYDTIDSVPVFSRKVVYRNFFIQRR